MKPVKRLTTGFFVGVGGSEAFRASGRGRPALALVARAGNPQALSAAARGPRSRRAGLADGGRDVGATLRRPRLGRLGAVT